MIAQVEGISAATKEMLNYGVLGAIVVVGGGIISTALFYLGLWVRPWIDKIGAAVVNNIDSNTVNVRILTTNSDRHTTQLAGQRKAMGHFGEAIVEAAPSEKQPAVRVHINKGHEALNDQQ